jgi:hypothetical protein
MKKNNIIGLEVLTVVVAKSSVFWYIMPSSPSKVNRCFGGTCRPHLVEGQRISQGRNQCEAGSNLLHTGFLLGLFFDTEHEVTRSSETLVNFQRATWCYIPEDRTLNYYVDFLFWQHSYHISSGITFK